MRTQEDFGGPAFAKLQMKTHVLTAVAFGGDPDVEIDHNAPPPQVSWAWPQSPESESNEHKGVDKDILALLESSKLNGQEN